MMNGGLDTEKVRQWRVRLARFARSGLTVARFCRGEAVSVPSFYHWRKKLAWADGPGPDGRSGPRDHRSPNPKKSLGLFRRVALTAAQGSTATQGRTSAEASTAAGVVIRLPGGVEIELGNDRSAIEQVVGQLLRHQCRLGESDQDRSNGGRSC
jgi:hypothetical protein